MKHYRTHLIKSQMFHCRIFIILPPAYVFDIRCSMGSHPTNCHRIWEAFRCTWALKTDWISACIRVDYVCVHSTNFALSIVPCCTGQGGLRCGTSYRKPAANSIKLDTVVQVPCTRLHHASFSSPPTQWLVRNLYCISIMHCLYCLCCIQFIYCTSLCCAHLNLSSNTFT